MRLALISDIHGNLPAFQAVLDRIDQEGVDATVCLGDTVGYGPYPSECIDVMMDRGIPSVLGNHDACMVGKLNFTFFGEPNRSLLRWTRDHLRPDQIAWLEGLPMVIEHPASFIAAHASPINPERWQWLDSAITCREVLARVDYDFVFVGHTHVPALVSSELGVFGLERGYRFLINPGSVGQGRDHDRRASFGILDLDAFTYQNIRLHYDAIPLRASLTRLGYTDMEVKRLLNG